MKKRVCITIKSLANGGAEKQSLILASALQEKYDTYFVAINADPQHPKHLQFIENNHITFRALEGNLAGKMAAFIHFLKEKEIDVLFTYLPGDTLFATIAGKKAGVKHILGGIRNARIPFIKWRILKLLHNNYLSGTISNSQAARDYFVGKGFSSNKLLVIPNGIAVPEQYTDHPFKDTLTVISVGRFVEQKDYLTALRAISHLKSQLNDTVNIKYQIIGWGKLEQEIRNWIQELDLTNEAELIINPDNVAEYLQKAHIYLCSSTFEGVSNSIMEALSYSLPVVATDAGDNSHLVKNDENGYILPIGDFEGLGNKLMELMIWNDRREKFGKKSLDLLRQHYSIPVWREHYFNIMDSLEAV